MDGSCSISSLSRIVRVLFGQSGIVRVLYRHCHGWLKPQSFTGLTNSHSSSHGPHTHTTAPRVNAAIIRRRIRFFSSSSGCLILTFVDRTKRLLSKGKQTNHVVCMNGDSRTWHAARSLAALFCAVSFVLSGSVKCADGQGLISKIRERKLRSCVNWQGAIKHKTTCRSTWVLKFTASEILWLQMLKYKDST